MWRGDQNKPMPDSRSITLLIPGLLDNLPEKLPRLPALETLLARADRRDDLSVGYERTLMHLFGQPQSPDRDVPEGALCRYAQTGEKPEGVWLCAAPVHLFADQSRVYLNTIDETALSEEEATQLIEELNKLYAEDGWEFIQHTRTRWYLRIADQPAIRTTPLREVDGKPIHDKLPQGEDALQWHRVMNEMQMLLHSSPVNMARQERGAMPINGVWLWGVGELPDANTEQQWSKVWTNDLMASGFALLSNTSVHNLSMTLEQCLQEMDGGEQLITFTPDTSGDPAARLLKWEEDWFVPLLTALRKREVECLRINSADGRQWLLKRQNLWRFWRRQGGILG